MIEERVAALVGSRVMALRPIQSRGYAAAFHAIAELEDGRTAFVKSGAEEVTSGFLRQEIPIYRAVSGPFMPALLGADEADPPILVLEDLSGARWVPPWDEGAVEAVLAALGTVAATTPPDWLDPTREGAGPASRRLGRDRSRSRAVPHPRPRVRELAEEEPARSAQRR